VKLVGFVTGFSTELEVAGMSFSPNLGGEKVDIPGFGALLGTKGVKLGFAGTFVALPSISSRESKKSNTSLSVFLAINEKLFYTND
jgi:hypothetical protein